MSTPRLSLVMGGGLSAAEGSDISLPLPESGTMHLHIHFGEKAAPPMAVANRSLSGWGCLIVGVGVGLMAAFGSVYQLGHRAAPDDVSNLRPRPNLGSLVSPDAEMPSAAALGLPAIQRQLATPPQIIPPPRVLQQPGVTTVAPSLAPSAPGSSRNAFGLEN